MRSRCFSALALWIYRDIMSALWHLYRSVFSTYVLDQRTLVLECVTLAQVVEFVVQVLVDFARGTVLDQQAAEDS
jgi:hypothetical protein